VREVLFELGAVDLAQGAAKGGFAGNLGALWLEAGDEVHGV
jgi:hypothetical protein